MYAPAGRTTVATETEAEITSPRLGVGVLGIAIGVLLTLVCMHSFVDPSISLLAAVGHELGHLASLL